ncbi:type I methionyl aminopeptidase [Leucobacter sp. cx-42]|uniref:type I methionyl aminopeptidase n=1 Tax=unclassified Leucobacter TaxID=2621730 RepID=UPI00165EA541|nr:MULTISPECIES: type I methionyl aminopeptidase [unclassified Leucobacter]MBC9954859.1 type I methionyl aminopeptidase [Leucobacter sp. cx-42]
MPFDSHGHIIPGAYPAPRTVPADIQRPPYVGLKTPPAYTGDNTYTEAEIDLIRAAGRISSGALDAVGAAIRPGITTAEIDRIAHEYVVAAGAYPSTLGYRGYRASSCTSVNEVICHGIPDDTVLREGDIVNVDVTSYLDGYHGDTNRTYRVGEVSEEVDLLIERTHEAMMRGIKAARPGREVNVIGRVIETYAKRFGYGVVRDFTGHGVGSSFHSGLIIPHYDSAPSYADIIKPGMVFTVEPMLTLGTHEWTQWNDGWTVTTRDKSITAQFEHTVVIREDGFELLTVSE